MGESKKVRVLEISHGLAPGGIESFIINIFENINKDEFEVSFALATDYHQFHEDRLIKQGAKIYKTCDLDGIGKKIKHFFKLIKLLKYEETFDVVHTHIDFFNGINLLAAFIAKVPIRISHSHNTNSANTQKEKNSVFVKIYRMCMRVLINLFATDIMGCSEDANKYMYGKRYKKAKVIYNGLDIDKFKNRLNTKEELVIGNKINLITIGRICEQKNSKFIVEIINDLCKVNKNICLKWIGKGPQEQEVKSLIKKYNLENYIELLGTCNNIPEILSKMDYMIFPSKWEGLGIALIEAQLASVPCFISDKIPNEADLGLCNIISLERSSKEWADNINNYINKNTFNKSINKEKAEKYDIKNIITILEKMYSRNNTGGDEKK